jgi:hypothetical protein
MEANYRTIYYSNGFNTRAWDSKVENSPLYPYLKRIMAEHLKKVIEDKTPQEVLGWFNYTRARTQENVQDSLHRS